MAFSWEPNYIPEEVKAEEIQPILLFLFTFGIVALRIKINLWKIQMHHLKRENVRPCCSIL